MSDSAGPSPTKSGAVGWSDAEKIAFLVEVAMQKGGPDWKNLQLPPGRTKKACMHVWQKMRDIAATAPHTAKTDAGEGEGTKKGKEKTGEKRGRKDDEMGAKGSKKTSKKAKLDRDGDGGDDEEFVKVEDVALNNDPH